MNSDSVDEHDVAVDDQVAEVIARCCDTEATVERDPDELVAVVSDAVWALVSDTLHDLGWEYLDNFNGCETWLSKDGSELMQFECAGVHLGVSPAEPWTAELSGAPGRD